MLRKSRFLLCAAAIGFAGICGAVSLAPACDKFCNDGLPRTSPNFDPDFRPNSSSNFDPSFTPNFGEAAEQTLPAPVAPKVRKNGNLKQASRKSSSQPVLAKRALALLNTKCVRCHGANRQESGLDLRSRKAILKGGDSGAGLVPGKPDESLILQRVRDGEMPPRNAGQLSTQEIATLQQWIAAGAP